MSCGCEHSLWCLSCDSSPWLLLYSSPPSLVVGALSYLSKVMLVMAPDLWWFVRSSTPASQCVTCWSMHLSTLCLCFAAETAVWKIRDNVVLSASLSVTATPGGSSEVSSSRSLLCFFASLEREADQFCIRVNILLISSCGLPRTCRIQPQFRSCWA